MSDPDFKGFVLEILSELGDWDGEAIQDLAVKYGILVEVKYDPEAHGPNDVDAEPGDPWYVFADGVR